MVHNTRNESIVDIISGSSAVGLVCIIYLSLNGTRITGWSIAAAELCICGIIFPIVYTRIRNQGSPKKGTAENQSSVGKGIIDGVLTEHGIKILERIEPKKMLKEIYTLWGEHKSSKNVPGHYKSAFMEKQIETENSLELYINLSSGCHVSFQKELILLCSVELAYPVMNEKSQIKGYIITKECIRLLMKEMFDAAKKNGLTMRMFKEDLKEYEEDFWN